jgi:hypothetical protein
MLNDWNNYDSNLGGYVKDIVDNDMTLLNQNGYNLLHLYLWDHNLLDDAVLKRWCGDPPAENCTSPYPEPAGFVNYPGNPAFSPQFLALQDFVAKAENHGLFVALHFASGQLIYEVQKTARSCSDIAHDFGAWAGGFITGLTPARHNVVAWGVAYAFGAVPGPWDPVLSPNSRYNECFGRVYKTVDDTSTKNAPPGLTGLGLIGVNPDWIFLPSNAMALRPAGGYQWDVTRAQRVANNMNEELTLLYGTPKSPDVYMFQFWNANAADLRSNLSTLINSNGGDPSRMTIPANLIFPVEFGTSSPGTGGDSWGDDQTPTTTVSGQNAWLMNTLCTLASLTKVCLLGNVRSDNPMDQFTLVQLRPSLALERLLGSGVGVSCLRLQDSMEHPCRL